MPDPNAHGFRRADRPSFKACRWRKLASSDVWSREEFFEKEFETREEPMYMNSADQKSLSEKSRIY